MPEENNVVPKRGRGRPRMTAEEKAIAKQKRKTGELPTVRRNRPDLANFGHENVQTGDNSKYLTHVMVTMSQPKIDISDPEQVQERIQWYFGHCVSSDMKPTVKGLCNALKITRKALWDWKNGTYRPGSHQDIILQAYDTLEELWENYMLNGKINPVSGIFLGKNQWGYSDKQEFVLTPNNGIDEVNAVDLEAKYAELPDD